MAEWAAEYRFPTGQILKLVNGDLTAEKVDAIVNAANAYLMHGGGVAGAIVRRGGFKIQEESNAWLRTRGSVSHESPAFTSGGNLACKYIIHAVGPVWGEGDEDRKLDAAIKGSLTLAEELKVTSLALPPISTGIFGFPKDRAARIILNAIDSYFNENPDSGLRQVRITIIDDLTFKVFATAFEEWVSSH